MLPGIGLLVPEREDEIDRVNFSTPWFECMAGIKKMTVSMPKACGLKSTVKQYLRLKRSRGRLFRIQGTPNLIWAFIQDRRKEIVDLTKMSK